MFTIMSIHIPAFAETEFPERNGERIVDHIGYFANNDRSLYESLIDMLQGDYVIVILDRTDGDGFNYTQMLF